MEKKNLFTVTMEEEVHKKVKKITSYVWSPFLKIIYLSHDIPAPVLSLLKQPFAKSCNTNYYFCRIKLHYKRVHQISPSKRVDCRAYCRRSVDELSTSTPTNGLGETGGNRHIRDKNYIKARKKF